MRLHTSTHKDPVPNVPEWEPLTIRLMGWRNQYPVGHNYWVLYDDEYRRAVKQDAARMVTI